MKVGFIIPTYNNEKRVALLPQHIENFENEIVIENGFGQNLNISDEEYIEKGCKVDTRENIFKTCDAIFCLKLIQESDYEYLRENQMIVGWTHPTGSGAKFMELQAIPKNLIIVDLDNIYPSVFYKNEKISIPWIRPNFVRNNSFIAGYASTLHALMNFGELPNSNKRVAILGSGNVSQGAFDIISKFNVDVTMYYRKTLHLFKDEIEDFDIIINGIEVDNSDNIITKEDLLKVKKGCFIIDAAADAGNAIYGTRYSTIDDPIYYKDGIYYYVVNNAPSVLFKKASEEISKSFSKHIYKNDFAKFKELIEK